jgi:predicted Rossmann fold nucleotide-binding protein DprA/Smf involved in DNA uptake
MEDILHMSLWEIYNKVTIITGIVKGIDSVAYNHTESYQQN